MAAATPSTKALHCWCPSTMLYAKGTQVCRGFRLPCIFRPSRGSCRPMPAMIAAPPLPFAGCHLRRGAARAKHTGRALQLPASRLHCQSASRVCRYVTRCSAGGVSGEPLAPLPGTSVSLVQRVKGFFNGAKLDRSKLAALGASALLSYGFVSNINAVTLLIISWVSFAKSTGLSPLAPGQWKAYLVRCAPLGFFPPLADLSRRARPLSSSHTPHCTPSSVRLCSRGDPLL
jgi:hypothetical protein